MRIPNSVGAAIAAITIVLSNPPALAADELSAEWIAQHYDTLELITPSPVEVDPVVAAACTTPAALGSPKGPHADSRISVYANNAAQAALGGSGQFAAGSVIVKLKHRSDWGGQEAIGGMVKRRAGYNPAGGDWEYFYQEGSKLESGLLTNCVECHASAAAHDHVFASWIGATASRRPRDSTP